MDRRDFYFKQPVTEAELNGAFDAVENAMFRLMTDMDIIGVLQACVGAQVTPVPNLNVTVSGPGFAYDEAGERMTVAAPFESVDVSQDSSHVPTTVAGGGNEKWVSVFLKFIRALSDPRVDGNSNTVYFVSNESKEYVVVQGAEAAIGTAPRPTLDPTSILLFDVHRTFGQTQIFNGDIDTTRRQDAFVIAQTPVSIRAGTVYGAIAAQLQALNDHILNLGGAHPDTAITVVAHAGTRFSLSGAGSVDDQMLAIQEQIDNFMTDGVDAIFQVADLTALRAIGPGSRFANQMAFVQDVSGVGGIYFWKPGGGDADDGVFTILPADAPAFGRWVANAKGARGVANGIVQLDGSAKVPPANLPWAILDAFYDGTAGGGAWQVGPAVIGDTAFHLAPGGPMASFPSLLTTDKIAVEMMFQYAFSTAGTFFTLNFTRNGSAIANPQWTSDVRTPPENQTNGYFRAIFPALAGTNNIHFGYNAGNGAQNLTIVPVDSHIVVYRP